MAALDGKLSTHLLDVYGSVVTGETDIAGNLLKRDRSMVSVQLQITHDLTQAQRTMVRVGHGAAVDFVRLKRRMVGVDDQVAADAPQLDPPVMGVDAGLLNCLIHVEMRANVPPTRPTCTAPWLCCTAAAPAVPARWS